MDDEQTQIELAASVMQQGMRIDITVENIDTAIPSLIEYLRENYGARCEREGNEVTAHFGGAEGSAYFKKA